MSDSHDDKLLTDDLEAFLAGDEQAIPPVEFTGTGDELTTASLDDAANWTLRRIRRARQELERIERTAAAERARVEAWQEDRSAGARQLIERETANLEQITRRLVELNPKRKTVRLPNGEVKLAAPGAPSLVVDDEAALLKWAQERHPGLVETVTVRKVGKADVKQLVQAVPMSDDEAGDGQPDKVLAWAVETATGERVPGVHLETPARDRFSFKA